MILRGQKELRGTTLLTAWNWGFLAAICWSATWFADQFVRFLSPELADHMWYASAVLVLCPPIAVLGSRRPGARVWTCFILFPMLFALGWPVVSARFHATVPRGLQLETPQVVAYTLVLVMGIGNYCGTRFTLSALLYGTAAIAIAISSSVVSPVFLSNRAETRFWSTIVMVLAVLLVKSSKRPVAASKFDRLWFDFFDAFGIVWGRRIQDRVNFILKNEGLNTRLEFDGFQIMTGSPNTSASTKPEVSEMNAGSSASEAEMRFEHVLRWLLRRFVDPEWIDRRLGTGPAENENLAKRLT